MMGNTHSTKSSRGVQIWGSGGSEGENEIIQFFNEINGGGGNVPYLCILKWRSKTKLKQNKYLIKFFNV